MIQSQHDGNTANHRPDIYKFHPSSRDSTNEQSFRVTSLRSASWSAKRYLSFKLPTSQDLRHGLCKKPISRPSTRTDFSLHPKYGRSNRSQIAVYLLAASCNPTVVYCELDPPEQWRCSSTVLSPRHEPSTRPTFNRPRPYARRTLARLAGGVNR